MSVGPGVWDRERRRRSLAILIFGRDAGHGTTAMVGVALAGVVRTYPPKALDGAVALNHSI
jgi:hypothetical protein